MAIRKSTRRTSAASAERAPRSGKAKPDAHEPAFSFMRLFKSVDVEVWKAMEPARRGERNRQFNRVFSAYVFIRDLRQREDSESRENHIRVDIVSGRKIASPRMVLLGELVGVDLLGHIAKAHTSYTIHFQVISPTSELNAFLSREILELTGLDINGNDPAFRHLTQQNHA